MTDSDLLQQFAKGSERAFAELVRRHVDFVYAAALRHVAGDRHRAEDVVQQVFIDLARKAAKLPDHPSVIGWLYSSTRYTAINILRSEQRRAFREQQSDTMHVTSSKAEPHWEQIRPLIDDALQELDESDRQSVLLRFFGQQPFTVIGAQLGITENAAQKRVERALDRLNVALVRRGISSTSVALSMALTESSLAAPATLAGSVTSAALTNIAGSSLGVFTSMNALKVLAATAAVGIIGWSCAGWFRTTTAKQKTVQSGVEMAAKPINLPTRMEVMPNLSTNTNTLAHAIGTNPLPTHQSTQQIAAAKTTLPDNKIYLIEPGDTLAKIAEKTDLTPDELKTLNPETNWLRLRVGQQIRVW